MPPSWCLQVAVHQIPAPSFLLFCQLAVSALVARLGGALGIIEVDRMEWSKFKPFIWVTAGFLGTIFANIKVGGGKAMLSLSVFAFFPWNQGRGLQVTKAKDLQSKQQTDSFVWVMPMAC
eukprot:1159070-Pelagomonas_calceolata.AAC.8